MVIKAPEENIVAMIGSKLVPVIEMLAIRKWSDADITDDLQFLCAELNKHLQSLS
jgi:V-type H+-transporting ATPase subunit H